MKHDVQFTTIELLAIKEAIRNEYYANETDLLIAHEINEKIDAVVKRDLKEKETKK